MRRLATHWIFLLLGLAGYALAVRRKPEYVAFLPLLVLGLAGYALGPRFAMYAIPVLGLGLGLGLPLAAETLGLRRRAGLGLQAFLLVAIIGVHAWRALEPEPDPVLEPGHARALRVLDEYPANQGRVWAWWDQGYAAQYYAGLPTFADGGNTSRARIFLLGQAFGAADSRKAAGVLKLGAVARAAWTSETHDWRAAAYQSQPLELLADMPAIEAQRTIDSLGRRTRSWPDVRPDAFMVVSWGTLRQARWINYFSRWTLTDGAGGHGRLSSLKPPVRLDEDEGMLHTADGPVPLASIDILDEASHYRNRWPRADGAHAVINNSNGEGVLMDNTLYRMMAVQMLIGEPGRFDRHFELVADRSPAARVYRVR
jgi:dolichyl-diphosphooligosaccharide--protein glycosyltransferase